VRKGVGLELATELENDAISRMVLVGFRVALAISWTRLKKSAVAAYGRSPLWRRAASVSSRHAAGKDSREKRAWSSRRWSDAGSRRGRREPAAWEIAARAQTEGWSMPVKEGEKGIFLKLN
jgi:hypothetical protein